MTAKPHANHHLLVRLAALEEKVKTEFDLLHAKVEEYGLLCENRHFNALVTDQDNVSAYQQRIAELEKENNNLKQQVESGQRMYRHLEERLIRLERKVEETKEPVVDANIAHNNTETEVNVTNTTITENADQLFMFVRNGGEAEVKSIIASGVDVNVADHQGRTPLHIAASKGHTQISKYLLDKGADVNIKNQWGSTPLHFAAKNGLTVVCEYLLDKGADVNVKNQRGSTPLHFAASQGYTVICQYLLDKGAAVNSTNHMAQTPLHLACAKGHLVVVRLLVDRGASSSVKDIDLKTPVMLAQRGGHTPTEVNVTNTTVTENVATNVEQLFKFIRNGREAEVKSIIASGVDVSVPDHQGRTPLHIAAEEGYRAVCDYLLDKGANVNVKNKWGFTPLHHTTVSRKFRELVNKTHKMSNSSNFILSPSK